MHGNMTDRVGQMRSMVEGAVLRYGRLLDTQSYPEWLEYFTPDGIYQVIQRQNYDRGEPLYLINEALPVLSARLAAYAAEEEPPELHFFNGITAETARDPDRVAAQTAGIVFKAGEIAHVARYFFDFVAANDATLRAQRVLIVLEGPVVQTAITTPI